MAAKRSWTYGGKLVKYRPQHIVDRMYDRSYPAWPGSSPDGKILSDRNTTNHRAILR